MSFYIKKTGWIVKKLHSGQFLTTAEGKADWTNDPFANIVFFPSKENADKRIKKLKAEAVAILIDKETKTKKLFSVDIYVYNTANVHVNIFEVPMCFDKWDGDGLARKLFYEVENVKKHAENLRRKEIKKNKEAIAKLQAEIDKLESMKVEDLVGEAITSSLDNLDRGKKRDEEMELEEQRKEKRKQDRLAKKLNKK